MDLAGVATVGGNYYCTNVKGDGVGSHATAGGPAGCMLCVGMRQISDGTSSTLLLGEKTVNPSTATNYDFGSAGTNYSGWLSQWGAVSSVSHGINYLPRQSYCYGIQFGSRHVGGAHFAFCDGAVRYISQNIAWPTLKAIATRAGGETVGDF